MPTPIDTVLSRVKGEIRPQSDSSYMVTCPAHPDGHPSLKISVSDSGKVLMHCHASCSFRHILEAFGLTQAEIDPDESQPVPTRTVTPATSTPTRDFAALAMARVPSFNGTVRRYLADWWGIPESAFDLMPGIGAWLTKDRPDPGGGWTFPETDANGNIIGFMERYLKEPSRKSRPSGSQMGVYISTGWKERAGAIYLVEGASDTLAMSAAGLAALGRPSSKSSGKAIGYLAELLRDVPATRPIIVFGENDRKPDGTWPGREGAEHTAAKLITTLKRDVLIVYPPAPAKDVRVWLTERAKVCGWDKVGAELVAAITPKGTGRKVIIVTTNHYEVNSQTIAELATDPDLFIRSSVLVRVVHNPAKRKHDCSFPEGPKIIPVSLPTLDEHISRLCDFQSVRKKETVSVNPPEWCISGVRDRGNWGNMRTLESVVDYPVLRPDGTLLTTPGYDSLTDIYYHPTGTPPEIPSELTLETAKRAWDILQGAITDFPFLDDEDGKSIYRSAWLAGVLTPLARFAFRGPAPLFLVDGNVRGAGKGLLCDTVAIIVSGREFATTGFTPDDEEMRKRITAIALEGDRLVLLDNINGNLAGSSLDRALTSTLWKDRMLGHNTQIEAPLWATWYGTGNNVQVAGDTARRICHIRIEHPDEHPEERSDFVHKNLRAWVVENRPKLLGAALTILTAFAKAGSPIVGDAKPWGSYEGWSAVVRNAIIWLGLPDPGETRANMREQSDTASTAMNELISHWELLDKDGKGLTASQVIAILFPKHGDCPLALVDVAAAIESILVRNTGALLGYKFREYKRRNFGGRKLDRLGTHARAVRWSVFDAETNQPVSKRATSDEDDDEVPTRFTAKEPVSHPPAVASGKTNPSPNGDTPHKKGDRPDFNRFDDE